MFRQNIFSLPVLGYYVHLKDPFYRQCHRLSFYLNEKRDGDTEFKKIPIRWAGQGVTPNFNIFKSVFFIFRFYHFLVNLTFKRFYQALHFTLWLVWQVLFTGMLPSVQFFYLTFFLKSYQSLHLVFWPCGLYDRLCSRAGCFRCSSKLLSTSDSVAQKVSFSCQIAENQWLCNTARLFNLSKRYFLQNMPKFNLKVCLRNVKSAWQAVRWSRRSRLSRGFDFSAPRRLFRVLREPKENIRLFCENPRG